MDETIAKKIACYSLVFAAISVVALVTSYPTAFADQEQTDAHREQTDTLENEFEGKYVTIYFDAQRNRGTVLKDVSLKEMGGRMMLVGIGIDRRDSGNWTAGIRFGIPWESVESYYAMTPKQYEEGARKYTHPKEI